MTLAPQWKAVAVTNELVPMGSSCDNLIYLKLGRLNEIAGFSRDPFMPLNRTM